MNRIPIDTNDPDERQAVTALRAIRARLKLRIRMYQKFKPEQQERVLEIDVLMRELFELSNSLVAGKNDG